jgi:ribonuclease Z
MARVVFLGVLGYQPYRQRHTSCIILPEYGIVLDAGTGFHLVHEYTKLQTLDVYLTHLHDDHICGLLYMLGVLEEKDIQEVLLVGRNGMESYLRKREFSHPRFPVSLDRHNALLGVGLRFIETKPNHAYVSGSWAFDERMVNREYAVHVSHLPHPSGGSLAYDFFLPDGDGIKRVVYVTDTTLDMNIPAIRIFAEVLNEEPPDLLIAECNFADRHKERALLTGHSASSMVAAFVNAVQPRCVVLTHLHSQSSVKGEFFGEDILSWEEVNKQKTCDAEVFLAHMEEVFEV